MKTKLMMAVVAAAMAFAAQAATETVDGVTYTYSGGTITKVDGDAKIIVIPRKLGGNIVTALGPTDYNAVGAFQNNTAVMRVVIPETVSWIGSSTFSGCTSLIYVNVPAGVEKICRCCFDGCVKLSSLELPNGLREIEYRAFQMCSSLKKVILPDGLTKIDTQAFIRAGLIEVFIPGTVTEPGSTSFEECRDLMMVEFGTGVECVAYQMFNDCTSLKRVALADTVKRIEERAFSGCKSLQEIILPASVNEVSYGSFLSCGRVVFNGKPPSGLSVAGVTSVVYPKEYGALWRAQLEIAKIGGHVNPNKPVVTVVSSKVRENNPTVLDVVYKVTSTKPTVKVRALAFEDGERTLNKVTRPETFIDGTAANLGDAIAANVEHKLSWQVSSDFKTDLAKMKFEVLAVEDGILPLEFITIPANGTNKKMQLSWNLLTEVQVFDALLWLYADKDAGLTLTDGELRNGTTLFASGASVNYSHNYVSGAYVDNYFAMPYIFSKMGFSVLSGGKLTYANEMTRLGLSPSGIRQYAWRELND